VRARQQQKESKLIKNNFFLKIKKKLKILFLYPIFRFCAKAANNDDDDERYNPYIRAYLMGYMLYMLYIPLN